MKVAEYEKQFDEILEGQNNSYPYDSDDYLNYVKMSKARIRRWRKTGKIKPELSERIENIDQKLDWVLITEPWCGDAAHSHVFIQKLADLNPKINLSIQNRDAPGSEIDNYLTNGGKSIPILIVRDANGKDLFTWGPRPKDAQEMVLNFKSDTTTSPEDQKKILQKWYNKDKGSMIQDELNLLIKNKV